MRAVVCNEFGPLDHLVVEERPTPEPGEAMVVVDVAAAGVNFVDGLICEGRYQLKPPTPFVPGSEVAGVVSAVGPGASPWSVGDRVLVFCGFGGFAEQVVAPALSLVAVPDSVDLPRAAALIQSYCTMLFTLTRRTSVAPGEWVLVLGAGGGIGLAAVDVARALGARVIAAASTSDKLDAAVAMGAEATIAYEEEDLKVRARELSGGGVDVVVDPVGGRHSRAGAAGHPAPRALLRDRLRLGSDPVRPDQPGAPQQPDPGRRGLGRLDLQGPARGTGRSSTSSWAWWRTGGSIRPRPSTRPLDEAAAVMTALIDRTVTGKVVLVP